MKSEGPDGKSGHIHRGGGGDSKELHARCREAFSKLLERAGFSGRKPRLVACGGRAQAFSSFCSAHGAGIIPFVGLWIDSEEPLDDLDKTWEHLKKRDGWEKPDGGENEQVLFMTTCMETWICADRDTLRFHYGSELQETALPPLTQLEERHRHDIQERLTRATRLCTNAYRKGKRSFEIFGQLNPEVLKIYLPSFVRVLNVLERRLKAENSGIARSRFHLVVYRALRGALSRGFHPYMDLCAIRVPAYPVVLQKLQYTHLNAVRAGFVAAEKNWVYNSAPYYAAMADEMPHEALIGIALVWEVFEEE